MIAIGFIALCLAVVAAALLAYAHGCRQGQRDARRGDWYDELDGRE